MDIGKGGLALNLFRKDSMSLVEDTKDDSIGLVDTHVSCMGDLS